MFILDIDIYKANFFHFTITSLYSLLANNNAMDTRIIEGVTEEISNTRSFRSAHKFAVKRRHFDFKMCQHKICNINLK